MENDNSAELALPASVGEELPGREFKPGTEFDDDLLAALQGTVAPPESGDSDSEATAEGTPSAAPSLNDLAKSRGLDLDDLYKATVSLPDEQGAVTLQELKNGAAKFLKSESATQTLDTDRTEFANQKLRYMSELQQAIAALPAELLKDETKLAPVAEFIQSQQAQQDRLLLEVIPDWQDTAVKARDSDGITAFLGAEYGAPAEAWAQPAPAWARKLVYDHWQLHQRMKDIATKRKAPKGAKTGNNASAAVQDRQSRAVASARQGGDKLSAIVDLLQG